MQASGSHPRRLCDRRLRPLALSALARSASLCDGFAERFGIGAYSKPEPYHVTPYEGLYRNGPAHLEHSLDVTNEAEANAYLEKLNNLVTNIAQETELMKSEQASFGLMPDFLIKSTHF